MPQGRRKIPFSCKAKKQQMQAKKQRQQELHDNNDDDDDWSSYEYNMEYGTEVQKNKNTRHWCNGANNGMHRREAHKRNKQSNDRSTNISKEYGKEIQEINKQPNGRLSKDRYALQFFQESQDELRRRKEEALNSIVPLSLKDQEISNDYYPSGIDMPKRPPWDFNMTKEQLEMMEQRHFTEYLKSMGELSNFSYFELNLETWRQLWRVLEKSDILLVIVDIRYPVLMFPPYLYHYVTNELQKDMILVLNKVDLAPPALVVAWKEYFRNQYPKLHILMFTSYPTYNLRGNTDNNSGMKTIRRRGKLRMAAEGAQKLLEACKEIVMDKVDLSSWHEKIQEELQSDYDLDDVDHKDNVTIEEEDSSYLQHERYKNGVLTIGCIGTPNVGKSSLMNALMGKKVVSVSRTPGHTKHFQTIFLTKTVCLCDCPGLVFSSTVPKQLQILMGSFPIAQVREPYTTVKFLAERLDLPKLLRIQHPENDDTWSAMDICEGWAIKRDFKTGRAARLDTYRAANSLLRMSLEGKICLHMYPPNWAINKDKWQNHVDVETVRWIQARNGAADVPDTPTEYLSSEDEETYSEEHESKKSSENATSNNSMISKSEECDVVLPISNKFAVFNLE